MAAPAPTVYRPHYRVCTAPPPNPWRTVTVGPAHEFIYKSASFSPQLTIHSTKSLKAMAARAVMRANPPKSFLDKLTPDIKTLLTTTDLDPDRGHLELKSRDCPTACFVRVGGFADAPPDALNRAYPSLFSTELIPAAASVLCALNQADKDRNLDVPSIISHSISERYPFFMRLQALTSDALMPPLDVALVWFTHMLQSKEYNEWCSKTITPSLARFPHVWTRALSPTELQTATTNCRNRWQQAVTNAKLSKSDACFSYDFQPSSWPSKMVASKVANLDPNIVINDRTWVKELMRSTDMSISQLLQSDPSVLRSQRTYTSSIHPHALARGVLVSGAYQNGWTCDNCKVLMAKEKPMWHCEPCSFDLCDACLAHPQHRLTNAQPTVGTMLSVTETQTDYVKRTNPTSEKRLGNLFGVLKEKKTVAAHPHPLEYGSQSSEAYKNGWNCDGCKKHGTDKVWHCEKCQFDLCDSCIDMPVPCNGLFWRCSVCNHQSSGPTVCCLACNFNLCEVCVLDGPALRDAGQATASAAKVVSSAPPPMLSRALVGYQRYLYLLAKYPQSMEAQHFAPCPMIDLFWHTHLATPSAYFTDSVELLGSVRHHKLLPPSMQTPQLYSPFGAPSFEDKMWLSEFNETMAIYGSAPTQKLTQVSARCGAMEHNDFATWKSQVTFTKTESFGGISPYPIGPPPLPSGYLPPPPLTSAPHLPA